MDVAGYHTVHAVVPYNRDHATVDSTKDLGIITQNLTWENHYKLISGKAYKILGLICRSFSGNGPVETRKRYISLVHSQILY